jgi:putative oxidoreductase
MIIANNNVNLSNVRHRSKGLLLVFNIIVLLLVIFFSYMLVSHLVYFRKFSSDINNQIFSLSAARIIKYSIVGIELIIVLFLLSDTFIDAGIIAIIIFSSLNITYIALVLNGFFDRMPCSCVYGWHSLGWTSNLLIQICLGFTSITYLFLKYKFFLLASKAGNAENLK